VVRQICRCVSLRVLRDCAVLSDRSAIGMHDCHITHDVCPSRRVTVMHVHRPTMRHALTLARTSFSQGQGSCLSWLNVWQNTTKFHKNSCLEQRWRITVKRTQSFVLRKRTGWEQMEKETNSNGKQGNVQNAVEMVYARTTHGSLISNLEQK